MAVTKNRLKAAWSNGRPLIERIIARGGRCMEQVRDGESPLYFERWLLPNGVSVVIEYNETYREMFIEAAPRNGTWEALDAALDRAALPPTCTHTWVHPGTSPHATHCEKCGVPATVENGGRVK